MISPLVYNLIEKIRNRYKGKNELCNGVSGWWTEVLSLLRDVWLGVVWISSDWDMRKIEAWKERGDWGKRTIRAEAFVRESREITVKIYEIENPFHRFTEPCAFDIWLKSNRKGNSLVVQRLGVGTFTALSFIPGWEAKLSQTTWRDFLYLSS